MTDPQRSAALKGNQNAKKGGAKTEVKKAPYRYTVGGFFATKKQLDESIAKEDAAYTKLNNNAQSVFDMRDAFHKAVEESDQELAAAQANFAKTPFKDPVAKVKSVGAVVAANTMRDKARDDLYAVLNSKAMRDADKKYEQSYEELKAARLRRVEREIATTMYPVNLAAQTSSDIKTSVKTVKSQASAAMKSISTSAQQASADAKAYLKKLKK